MAEMRKTSSGEDREMITTAQVMEWFNWERSSALSQRFDYFVWLIRDTSMPESEKLETV